LNKTGKKVLLVENDESQWSTIGKVFLENGHHFCAVGDGLCAYKKIVDDHFDLIIVEQHLPKMSGLDLLRRIKEINATIPVILVSADACIHEAVEAMKLGAVDFIIKPLNVETLNVIIHHTITPCPEKDIPILPVTSGQNDKHRIITQNKEMLHLLENASMIADSQASVLIQGESGTGKELVARHIHHHSQRKEKPFVAINCAALPETLLESELFGHEKGAFTGAITRKKGKFEIADHGTLLLDEISEMDLGLQSKLLRVLQEREIDRVGGTNTIPIDVRIIATTNRDIEKHIQEGKFREDLFYRLNVIPIHLPPLRERKDDIPLLVDHFILKYNQIDKRYVKCLTDEALHLFHQMSWKGNVRELESIIQRAVLMCKGEKVTAADIFVNDNGQPVYTPPYHPVSSIHPITLKELEKKTIFQTLDRTNGNRTHAAEILGISVRTLRNKLTEYRSTMESQ